MKTLSLFVVVVVVALKWTAGYVTNDDDVWQAPSYLAKVDAQVCLPYSPRLLLPLSFSCSTASHMVCSWRQPQARVLHNGQRLMPSLDGERERTTMCAGNVAMWQCSNSCLYLSLSRFNCSSVSFPG